MNSCLYIVGTPIGNMQDITLRALDTLKSVDVIACEDTRHTLKLLSKYDIKKPLISYYKEKEREGAKKIISLLQDGKKVALVTDAGMPCISDPGSILVEEVKENGLKIEMIPGPTALTTAMAYSGITYRTFTFLGFLPEKTKDKTTLVSPFITTPTSLVFYCSPHNINKDLDFLYSILGERKVHIIKELTKIHESEIVANLSCANIEEPKGEYVVIIEKGEYIDSLSNLSPKEMLISLIDNGMNKKDAIKQVAKTYSLQKDFVYKLALEIQR